MRQLTQSKEIPPDPCPGCFKGQVCRTPKCGRLSSPALLKLYGGHPG